MPVKLENKNCQRYFERIPSLSLTKTTNHKIVKPENCEKNILESHQINAALTNQTTISQIKGIIVSGER